MTQKHVLTKFFFFLGLNTLNIYHYATTNLLQKISTLSKGSRLSTTSDDSYKIRKSISWTTSILAHLSAHLLASLKIWVIVQFVRALVRFLQSLKRGSNMRLIEEGLVSKCTRTSASSLIFFHQLTWLNIVRDTFTHPNPQHILLWFIYNQIFSRGHGTQISIYNFSKLWKG